MQEAGGDRRFRDNVAEGAAGLANARTVTFAGVLDAPRASLLPLSEVSQWDPVSARAGVMSNQMSAFGAAARALPGFASYIQRRTRCLYAA
jgi:hypothetical protein